MSITVMLSTTLRDYVPGYRPDRGLSVEVDGLTAGELAERLGLPLGEIKILMLNGRHAAMNQPIKDGDRVSYFPAVGGG